MSQVSRSYRYVGAYRNFTGWLGEPPNQFKVEGGVTTLVGPERDVNAQGRLLQLLFQAFPEGSEELAAKELELYGPPKQEGTNNGSGDLPPAGPESDGTANVHGGDGQDGGQPPEEGTGNVGGTDAGPTGQAQRDPDGNGPQHLVNDPPALADEKLKKALAKLDPKNDSHWTKDGLPALTAVESFYGSSSLKRADITAAAPDLRRNTAPELG